MKLTAVGKLLLFLVGLGLVVLAFVRFVPAEDRAKLLDRLRGRTSGAAPSAAETPTPSSDRPATITHRLSLSGSNTIGKDLAPALVEGFLRKLGASSIERRAGKPDEMTIEAVLPDGAAAIEIRAHGSSTAFEALSSGGAEIGMASRRIKTDEARTLASLGNMLSPACEHILGLDGVAVIVDPGNSVDALSIDQIRDLFTGRITDWSTVGGTAGPVATFARDDRSGTYDTFKSLVLADRPLAASAERYEDSERLAADVTARRGSIGFVGLAYVAGAKALKVHEGGSVPYRPTVFTVRTEDYLLSRRLYLYSASNPRNPWVSQFLEFALSHDGQSIVDTIGFVGQSLVDAVTERGEPGAAGRAAPAPNAPPEYLRVTQGATRLPLDFRFESGSDQLDNKARRDVGRLLESLSAPANRGREILLLGFADSQGAEATNLRLSAGRAEAVARELAAEGIRAGVSRGFGSALPVASNDSEAGRGRNRRVEVWIR